MNKAEIGMLHSGIPNNPKGVTEIETKLWDQLKSKGAEWKEQDDFQIGIVEWKDMANYTGAFLSKAAQTGMVLQKERMKQVCISMKNMANV